MLDDSAAFGDALAAAVRVAIPEPEPWPDCHPDGHVVPTALRATFGFPELACDCDAHCIRHRAYYAGFDRPFRVGAPHLG